MTEKLLALLDKLRSRTVDGKVDWQRTADDEAYLAPFPNYSVLIFPHDPGEPVPDYIVRIVDQTGSTIEEISKVDLAQIAQRSPLEAYEFMSELYKGARRKAMGAAQAFDTILESLEKDESGLTIHSAKYGAGGHWTDVSAVLKGHIVEGRLNVIAGNQLAGDPAPNVVKELSVDYSYRDKRQTTTVKEGESLSLP